MISRRRLLQSACAASAGAAFATPAAARDAPSGWDWLPTTQTSAERAFRLGRRGGRTWLVDPQGNPFFSIGFNHIDPATLRYPDNRDLWRTKYGGSMRRWLEEAVRPDLIDWGFNSIGNTTEMASNGPTNHRQSRRFTVDEYRWLGMPYCHQLPFAEFHHWDAQTRLPDFFAPEFEDWCDHVAREHCATMAGDELLIGYFYVDCPGWVHTHPHSRWRGALFDYKRLETAAGRDALRRLATQYYRVTHDAIRRYDPSTLILGDRYEARGRMAVEVLESAKPYVDVLSFQDFGKPGVIREDLEKWASTIGLPVLLADSGGRVVLPDGSHRHDTRAYREIMEITRSNPDCVGFHLCGAYMKNRIRRKGLRFADESPDTEVIEAIRRVNRDTHQWISTAAA